MKRLKNINKIGLLFEISGFLFLLLIWLLLSYVFKKSGNYLLPDPSDTFKQLGIILLDKDNTLYVAIGWTFLRVIIGWIIAFILAMILGTLSGLYPYINRFLKPFIVFTRVMPSAVIIIILGAIFLSYRGASNFLPSILVFLVSFPLIFEAFSTSIQNEDISIINSLEIECGFRSFKSVSSVLWPNAMPYVILSSIQSFGLAVKTAIMSEIISSNSTSNSGLGTLIYLSRDIVDMDSVMAYSLIAIFIVLIIDIPFSIFVSKNKNL